MSKPVFVAIVAAYLAVLVATAVVIIHQAVAEREELQARCTEIVGTKYWFCHDSGRIVEQ